MRYKNITLVFEPTVVLTAEMAIVDDGITKMRQWLQEYRPECLSEEGRDMALQGLLPHDGTETVGESVRQLTDNEMYVELAGRKCYNSFGLKAGRKTNADYIKHTQDGEIKHASILYHAKMSFFIAGVSRRVSHEMIRNYVGSDRNEEGSPSQESTRYTHHPGHFVVHPRDIEQGPQAVAAFAEDMHVNYNKYLAYIDSQVTSHKAQYGEEPKGMDRKRIYEAASARLSHGCETSWLWTSNPMAIAKFMHERENEAADLEINRLATAWRKVVMARSPNLFPQPWMNK